MTTMPRHLLTLTIALLLSGMLSAQCVQQPPEPLRAQTYLPHFPGDPARSASEAGALGYMRTLVNAERQYFKKHTKYATTLAALAASPGSFTKRMAHTTDRGDYVASFHGTEKKFWVQMTPKQFDATHRAFWDNENAIIRVEPDKPATETSPVLRPD